MHSALDALSSAAGVGRREAAELATGHLNAMQAMSQAMPMTYANYLEHIVSCRLFCRPIIAHLINCHVIAVSNHDRGVVLFDLDSDYVKPHARRGVIEDAVEQLSRDAGRRVLLIGRASRMGALRYNRSPSGRRALAVKDLLIEKGVEPARIESMWFGWEEPQIDDWIAREYGLEREFELGKAQMNQSVVMVFY